MILGIFRPPIFAYRYKLWKFMEETSIQMRILWLLVEDFNQGWFEEEKFNKNTILERVVDFQKALFQVGLIKVCFAGNWLTWTNNRND